MFFILYTIIFYTTEALNIVQQLQEGLKEHYCDHKTKHNEYLLKKANLESDAGEEEKRRQSEISKKIEHWNQCYRNLQFHQQTRILAQEINQIQIPPMP